mmetsp:Transcript_54532/g.125165  ORF Transcript_54532/g.125165 Transcript_54532/m.125165 type:complete len:230 (+) Transcript_54532:1995-2684(+)
MIASCKRCELPLYKTGSSEEKKPAAALAHRCRSSEDHTAPSTTRNGIVDGTALNPTNPLAKVSAWESVARSEASSWSMCLRVIPMKLDVLITSSPCSVKFIGAQFVNCLETRTSSQGLLRKYADLIGPPGCGLCRRRCCKASSIASETSWHFAIWSIRHSWLLFSRAISSSQALAGSHLRRSAVRTDSSWALADWTTIVNGSDMPRSCEADRSMLPSLTTAISLTCFEP